MNLTNFYVKYFHFLMSNLDAIICILSDVDQKNSSLELKFGSFASGLAEVNLHSLRKTKILCTITSTSSRELIWKLGWSWNECGTLKYVAWRPFIALENHWFGQFEDKVIAIMLDTKVIILFNIFLLSLSSVSSIRSGLKLFYTDCYLIVWWVTVINDS